MARANKMTYNISKTCQIRNLSEIYQKYFGFPSKGYFVEVGAFDGESFSNTSCLADHGWKGLYVEPIHEYYLQCVARHNKNDVLIENVAIGLNEGLEEIYCGGCLTTLDKEQVLRCNEIDWCKNQKFEKRLCYQVKLDKLLKRHKIPKNFDILVVDVEGKESEVFETFDLNEYCPKMLIVELEDCHPSFQKYEQHVANMKNLRNFILKKEYVEIYKDYINTIFINSRK